MTLYSLHYFSFSSFSRAASFSHAQLLSPILFLPQNPIQNPLLAAVQTLLPSTTGAQARLHRRITKRRYHSSSPQPQARLLTVQIVNIASKCGSDSKMDRLPERELDVEPHPHRLEREFAQENIQREPGANEHETHGLCEGRITYELALERELEYRKRLKDAGLQPFATNRVPPTPPQKLPLEHNLKRKVISGVHTESVPIGSPSPRPPLQNWQVESRKLHSQQPPTKRLNCYRTLTQHSPQQLNCSQPPDQMFKHKPHLQHQRGCRQPPLGPLHRPVARQTNWPQQSNQPAVNNQVKFYRCNLCQMNFDTSSKLHLHYQTEEHNARRKFTNINVPNGSTMVWCEECNVPCMNETLLAQHRAGKKHAACLRLLAQSATSTAAGGAPPRI